MTAGLLGAWAILSFLLALTLLAPATGYLDHGTAAMRTASVLLFFCVGAELLGAGLSTVTRAAADRAQSTPPVSQFTDMDRGEAPSDAARGRGDITKDSQPRL
jgi:hypothetical protein